MATVLIIDDDAHMREMLADMAAVAGHEAIQAPDGRIGLELFRSRPADLVVADMIMPEKDGMDTIAELRRDFPLVKIIAVSGGGITGPYSYLMMARRFGADIVLSKPIKKDQFLNALRELLEGDRLHG
jgi:DNA-binding response OmpR family regulator